MDTNFQVSNSAQIAQNQLLSDGFTCQGCNHHLPMEFNVRTENFCYLCDPNITLEECLSDEPLERVPKAIR